MYSDGFDVAFIDFYHYRSHDQIDRQHESKPLFAVDHYAFRAQQRDMLDTHSRALAQIRMRLQLSTCGQTRFQRANSMILSPSAAVRARFAAESGGRPRI